MALPLLAVQFPDTVIMGRHWKFFGAVPMARAIPVPNYMELFAALDLIWGMCESLLTRLNQKEEHLCEHLDSDLMGNLVGNSGLVLGVGITT